MKLLNVCEKGLKSLISKRLIILFMIVLMSSLAFAQGGLYAELKSMTGQYQGEVMPQPFKSVFGNERINIYIDDLNMNAVTAEGKLIALQEGLLDDPTMNLYSTEATINKILNSENAGEDLQNALDNKEITYSGVGTGKKIKLFFVKIAAKIASWFM